MISVRGKWYPDQAGKSYLEESRMAIKFNESNAGGYQQLQAGAHAVVITRVIELGERQTDFGKRNEVCFQFEHPSGASISRTVSATLAPQSELSKLATAAGFNPRAPESALGKSVRIMVESYTPPNSQFAKMRVSKFGTATEALPVDGVSLLTYDRESRDPLVFAQLPQWQQVRITQAGIAPGAAADGFEWDGLPTVNAEDAEEWL
jgi:hypothetical protein